MPTFQVFFVSVVCKGGYMCDAIFQFGHVVL